MSGKRLWEKGEATDEDVLAFCVGDDHELDERLVAYDVRASIAHAAMLAECGYLAAADRDAIADGLRAIGEAHARGEWHIAREEEDCHTALETRLTARIGEAGSRIHLGRSRNDQVLAALRLYLKEALERLAVGAEAVATRLDAIGAAQGDVAIPGYTHLQRAMPSTVGLWAGGFASELRDDATGLRAARRRADRNPLGSAAGYGVPVLELRRDHTTAALGFAETQEPVTAVQLSRGKAEAEAAFQVALLMQDFGRLAADVVLYTSSEFALLALDRKVTTGSSIMPQKRNPDVFELVRGRAALATGDLAAVLAITAKLPSGYHRDLQLLKAPLFSTIDRAHETAAVFPRALAGLTFDVERARAATSDPGLHATAEAYRLVRDEGIPFRDAYRRAAEGFRG